MNLIDRTAYRQIIGSLMHNTLLLLEYPDIEPTDFIETPMARACFHAIRRLYEAGAKQLSIFEIDQEFENNRDTAAANQYFSNGGIEFLTSAYEFAEPSNFNIYYNRVKKYSLLYHLQKAHYDISDYYVNDKDNVDPIKENEIRERLETSTLDDILNSVEGKFNEIKNNFINGKKDKGDPANNIFSLIDSLKEHPDSGPDLEGEIFTNACRGAREGCLFLKSASTNAGKSRTSVFDACRLAYPERWSHERGTFIHELDFDEPRQPRKVLFIVTEMDIEEIQTIMLAYLSGVDEAHILSGRYELDEEERVKYAATIMQKYQGYFLVEAISDPNLINVETTIKKYTIMDKVKYVFFDYIHSTASMMNQFAKNGLREDVILMMMANQLKQIAKDYGVFIFSATQVNAKGMETDGEFKDESCIRGSKAVADKCDMGCVISRVSDEVWNNILPKLRQKAREGRVNADYLEKEDYKPTHIIDIYKMRRGRYRGVRIWSHIHLGTGRRLDLFMTTINGEVINWQMSGYTTMNEEIIGNWHDLIGAV